MKYLIRRLMHPLPLFLAIIVLIVGYGAVGMVRSAIALRADTHAAEEKIKAFLPVLDSMMGGGLATLENVRVIHYRHDNGGSTGVAPVRRHSQSGCWRYRR